MSTPTPSSLAEPANGSLAEPTNGSLVEPVETGIDPRGPQFTAAITVVVLVAILALPGAAATTLTAIQFALFTLGAIAGVQKTPHAWAFRTFIRPRLGKPTELEDPKPPQFAQAVGAGFTGGALIAFVLGATVVGQVLIGAALIAATLNAVFRFCLGCEVYLLIQRATN